MDFKTTRIAIGITAGTLLGMTVVAATGATGPAAADDVTASTITSTTSAAPTTSTGAAPTSTTMASMADAAPTTTTSVPVTTTTTSSVPPATPGNANRAIRALGPSAAASPTLTVTPRTGLAPGGQAVTVVGRGFDPTRNGGVGVYVVFGPKEADFATNAETFRSAKWIHPGATPSAGQAPLAADGSFTTTIEVVAGYTTSSGRQIDCRVLGCSILTMAAHGVPDRSQDTQASLTFASGGTTVPASPAPSGGGSTPMNVAASAAGGSTSGTGTSAGPSVLGASSARQSGTTSSGASSTGRVTGSLAQTGTESGPPLAVGAGAVLAGAGLVVASRRRESGTVRRWPDRTHCS